MCSQFPGLLQEQEWYIIIPRTYEFGLETSGASLIQFVQMLPFLAVRKILPWSLDHQPVESLGIRGGQRPQSHCYNQDLRWQNLFIKAESSQSTIYFKNEGDAEWEHYDFV